MNHNTKIIAGLTLLCATQASAGLILDTYDADPDSLSFGPRVLSASLNSDPFNQGGSFGIDTLFVSGADTGAVFFNSGIGAEQEASITYNDNNNGLNYNASSIQSFELDFLLVDLSFTANITMSTFGGGEASWDVVVPAGANYTATWSIADFVASGAFDIADVDEIAVNFNVTDRLTASLDFVATEFRAVVPTPGSLMLMGMGGFIAARRSR